MNKLTLSTMLFPFVALLASPASASCHTILLKSKPDALLDAFSTRDDAEWLAHGTGCYREDSASGCEWETTLKQDALIGTDRRLLVYNANHLGGSGAWDFVRVYGCINGKPEALLKAQYLYGAEIRVVSPDELVIVSNDPQANDPICCASEKKREHFVWSEGESRYVVRGTSSRARDPG